jgi:hypothetical protein
MKHLFITSLLLMKAFTNTAQAEPRYRCEDIPWFEETLKQLHADCNVAPPAPGVCRAHGFIGNSPSETIQACSAPATPYSAQQCGAVLTCPPSIQFCRAHGYVGNIPAEAIRACSARGTPYSSIQCTEVLTCQGDIGYFIAKNYFGTTPEEAIIACSAAGTPYSKQQCSADVQCKGSAYFCQNWTLTVNAFKDSVK